MFTPISFFKSESLPSFSATGGTQTTVGSYTVHTFTSTNTFSVTGSRVLEVLLVGGGGNGGNGQQFVHAIGGDGGQVVTTSMTFSTNAYTIRVGSAANLSSVEQPSSTILLQANAGDNGIASNNFSGAPGGDGNAGANPGGSGNPSNCNGGVGIANDFRTGVNQFYGGGGGGGLSVSGLSNNGGNGGGGRGASSVGAGFDANPGSVNTGGGGGGGARVSNRQNGASGGSGIVIIRYLTNP